MTKVKSFALLILFAAASGACSSELSVSKAGLSKKPRIVSLDAVEINPGDVVSVKGKYLHPNIKARIDLTELTWTTDNPNVGTLLMPNDLPEGVFHITFMSDEEVLSRSPLYNRSSLRELTASQLDPSAVCDTTLYRNAKNIVIRGSRKCGPLPKLCEKEGELDCIVPSTGASAATQNLAAKVLRDEEVAEIQGSADPDLPDCSEDGEGQCVVRNSSLKAALISDLTPSDIRAGVTVAGILGTLSGYSPLCSSDNQEDCIATDEFPAVDKLGVVAPNLAKFRSSLSIAGMSGLIPSCSIDGGTDCVPLGPAFAAAATQGAASKILLGNNVGLIDGSIPVRPLECTGDAQTNCTTTSNFPSVDRSSVLSQQGKYSTLLTLAGIPGSLAECNTDGETSCLTRLQFPAIQKTLLAASASRYRNTLSIAQVAGTLTDCTADGQTECFAHASFPSFQKSSAAPKIVSPLSLGLVSGTGIGRPSDCSSDGQVNCVSVADFPAMATSGAAPKILTLQSVGGIAGSAPVRPNTCDGSQIDSCVTTSSFPSLSRAYVQTNAALISDSLTFGGITGTLPTCTEGTSGCLVETTFSAALSAGAGPKIIQGQSVAGISGSALPKQPFCQEDGEVGCVADAAYPSFDSQFASEKVIDTESIGILAGSAPTPRPADCSASGESSCVANSAFPAMQVAGAAPKIRGGDVVGGVTGTGAIRPDDCTTGDEISCVTTPAFPAVDKNRLQANLNKVSTTLTLANLTGTFANCTADGQIGCLSNASFIPSSIVGAAPKILSGSSVAGVAGTAALTPSLCSSSGGTACVSHSDFPATDKANVVASSNKFKSNLTLLGVSGSIVECSADGQTTCHAPVNFPAALTTGAASKIMNLQTVAGVSGTVPGKPNDCSVDGEISCVTTNDLPSIDKSLILPEKVRRHTTIANVSGILDDCNADGATECVALAAFPSAEVAGASSKIISGHTLAGESGNAITKPSNCSTENATGCVAVPAFPAIEVSSLAAKAAKVRSANSVLSTSGSLIDCSTDGHEDCVTQAGFPAALVLTAAPKIITPHTLAGVVGTATPKPSDCTIDNQSGCTAVSNFPSVVRTNVNSNAIHTSFSAIGLTGTIQDCTADNQVGCKARTSHPSVIASNVQASIVRQGVTLAGKLGQYPSATYPLQGSSASGTDDASNWSNFKSRLSSDSSFEFFDSSGTRHVVTGDSDFVAGNIRNGVSILDVNGSYNAPGDCSTDGGQNCVTTSRYKAANAAGFTDMDVRAGTVVAGQLGNIFFPTEGINLALYNRTGTNSSAGADVYDSIDDYNSNGTFPADNNTIAPIPAWWLWVFLDQNGNGVCEHASGERCEFHDRMSKRGFTFLSTAMTWENAITACSSRAGGGFDGGHLATQKELMQSQINGIALYKNTDSRINFDNTYWTSTTDRATLPGGTNAWGISMFGYVNSFSKDTLLYPVCAK